MDRLPVAVLREVGVLALVGGVKDLELATRAAHSVPHVVQAYQLAPARRRALACMVKGGDVSACGQTPGCWDATPSGPWAAATLWMDELSREERRGEQREEEIRAEVRADVEAQWGAGAKPEPDGQGSDVSDCSSQPRRQLPLWPGRRRRASLARGAAQIPGGRSPSCGTTTAL